MRRLRLEAVEASADGVVMLRAEGPDAPVICLHPSDAEVCALRVALAGDDPFVSQAHALLARSLRVLGARPAMLRLARRSGCELEACLVIDREGEWVRVLVEPPQGLALAARLRLPVWAENELFEVTG